MIDAATVKACCSFYLHYKMTCASESAYETQKLPDVWDHNSVRQLWAQAFKNY